MRPAARFIALLVALLAACGPPRTSSALRPAPSAEPEAVDPAISEGQAFLTLAQVEAMLPTLALDQWFGMYVGSSKIGYAHAVVRRSEKGEPGAVVIDVAINLKVGGLGTEGATIVMGSTSYYDGEAPFGLREMVLSETSPDGAARKRFIVAEHGITVEETRDGEVRPPRILGTGTRETLPTVLASFITVPSTLRPRQSVTYYSFDSDEEGDSASRTTIKEITRRRISGIETDVVVFEEQTVGEQGVSTTVLAAAGGMLESTKGGMRMRVEDEAMARSDVAGFDILNDAVQLLGDATLGDPDRVDQLAMVLNGVPAGFALPSGPNQQVTVRPDGSVHVRTASVPGPAATEAEQRDALEPTSAIDAGHPAIVGLGAKLTAGATGDAARVEALRAWVYATLDKKLSSNIGVASQVLEKNVGDCTEHALLFTALARSQGIPARRISGVTYMGDEYRRFGWHEWAEAVIDGHWVQIDPSWEPPVANATHLKLGLSESGDSMLLMGVLTISLAEPAREDGSK